MPQIPEFANPIDALAHQKSSRITGCLALGLIVLISSIALAADPPAGVPKKIPPPEDLTFTTTDGLTLRATYFPSPEGKEAVPVILLHAFKGSRGDYADMALYLQQLGHAVIVPDLRGHGESTRLKDPASGRPIEIKAERLTINDFGKMVVRDLETVKAFLRERNNSGELNLEKLCVVGVEMGSVVAMNWAAEDWAYADLATGKQGKDVKALVLIAPEWTFKGFSINKALDFAPVQTQLSVLIVAGAKSKGLPEATRLHSRLERTHPLPPPDERRDKQDLYILTLDTSLAGSKMLGEKSLNLNKNVGIFIDYRLVKQNFAWTERKNPLE